MKACRRLGPRVTFQAAGLHVRTMAYRRWQRFIYETPSQQRAVIPEHESRVSVSSSSATGIADMPSPMSLVACPGRRRPKAPPSQAHWCRTGLEAFAEGRGNRHVVNRLTGSG